MRNHSLDPEIAAQVKLNAAMIYQTILRSCERNAAKGEHIHNGKAWTCKSIPAFGVLFPYLTLSQIRWSLDKLARKGLIEVGCFNKDRRDRTRWYTIPGPKKSVGENT